MFKIDKNKDIYFDYNCFHKYFILIIFKVINFFNENLYNISIIFLILIIILINYSSNYFNKY
jgi:hypothetical protein